MPEMIAIQTMIGLGKSLEGGIDGCNKITFNGATNSFVMVKCHAAADQGWYGVLVIIRVLSLVR